jgi:hypothetical protein
METKVRKHNLKVVERPLVKGKGTGEWRREESKRL